MKYRREMNDLNSESNNKAVDSLLNFETVKYFSNEPHEIKRYDESLAAYMKVLLHCTCLQCSTVAAHLMNTTV
jgi:ABC-type transport system involved in Fe-S cluster assembly fused permease/ATPase subunit